MFAFDGSSLLIGLGCFVLAVLMILVFALAKSAGQAEQLLTDQRRLPDER